MDAVTENDRVAAYEDHVKSLARKFVGWANAEFDDLAQEGRFAVLLSLRRGIPPSTQLIEWRMQSWVSYLRRLQHNDAVAYDLWLPSDIYEPVHE